MIGSHEAGVAICLHKGLNPVDSLSRDPAAVAEAVGELAVIDGAAAEGRFRQPGQAAVIGNLRQKLLRRHGQVSSHLCCFCDYVRR